MGIHSKDRDNLSNTLKIFYYNYSLISIKVAFIEICTVYNINTSFLTEQYPISATGDLKVKTNATLEV
jgi:hypothetical protein